MTPNNDRLLTTAALTNLTVPCRHTIISIYHIVHENKPMFCERIVRATAFLNAVNLSGVSSTDKPSVGVLTLIDLAGASSLSVGRRRRWSPARMRGLENRMSCRRRPRDARGERSANRHYCCYATPRPLDHAYRNGTQTASSDRLNMPKGSG